MRRPTPPRHHRTWGHRGLPTSTSEGTKLDTQPLKIFGVTSSSLLHLPFLLARRPQPGHGQPTLKPEALFLRLWRGQTLHHTPGQH